MEKLFLITLLTLFLCRQEADAQVDFNYYSWAHVLKLSYVSEEDFSSPYEANCYEQCIYDQQQGEPINCDEDCGEVLKISYYFLGHWSPFMGVPPISNFPEFSRIFTRYDNFDLPFYLNLYTDSMVNGSLWKYRWDNEFVCYRGLLEVFYKDGSKSVFQSNAICN